MDINAKIKIQNLNVVADKQHILKNINIEIPKNRITVVLGPSGCGKTTLLKCLNRLTDLYPELRGIKRRREIHKLVVNYLQQANLWDEVKKRLREPASN